MSYKLVVAVSPNIKLRYRWNKDEPIGLHFEVKKSKVNVTAKTNAYRSTTI